MPKITLTMDIEVEEVSAAKDALWDVVQDFGFPVYQLDVSLGNGSLETRAGGSTRGVVNLPPVTGDGKTDIDSFAEWVAGAFPDWALDDEAEDETDPDIKLPPMPGDCVEIDGLVYQVFSIDATGRVILDVLEELDMTDEGETVH